ncbi:glycosyltransferase family 4 protein [Aliiglaciecola sp. LCG003]|uniref:glycosyltransferase family 4 protein n=1 Tax=Aliiglaciecola sp. LCG003 TaxID=3053655 RepID=UPI0025736BAC|nr:glycosyltransferase family 4 protein [Aliiglaciecola sp. LCG003]WJG10403.1 glycosyltransferase family 4 protein [Aliiglaciecola sp. LCG003]
MSKPTRAMHISANQYPKLPTEHHSKVIWKELAKGFDEYHIVARSTDMSFSYTKEDNLHLHLIPSFGSRQFVFFLLSFILPVYFTRYRPTNVVAQCPVLGGFVAAIFKGMFDYTLFVEIHGEHYFKRLGNSFLSQMKYRFFYLLTRFTFNRANTIRSLSQTMTSYIEDVYGTLGSKILIIPNRVNLQIFKHVKNSYHIENGIVNIITVGRFSKLKNHENLLKDLYQTGIKFHLTIVGSGDLKESYNMIAKNNGDLTGLKILENLSHEQLSLELAKNDIYVHYSVSEGVPRAILEAMAAGLPVLATNVGYVEGVIEDNVNAMLINLPYRVNLEKCLRKTISNESFRNILGVNARSIIVEKFEWNHVFNMYRKAVMATEISS